MLAPAATSVAMDCTRGPWVGGLASGVLGLHGAPGGVWASAINHVTHPCALVWLGLGVVVREEPRPPPTCPTTTMDVGMAFAVLLPVGVNERLLVRLMVRP